MLIFMHIVQFYYDHSDDHIRNFEILPKVAKIYQNNNNVHLKQVEFHLKSFVFYALSLLLAYVFLLITKLVELLQQD